MRVGHGGWGRGDLKNKEAKIISSSAFKVVGDLYIYFL